MDIEKQIINAFPAINLKLVSDKFIVENQNLMEVRNRPDLLVYVPAYMLWVVRNKSEGLVDDWTIGALAEYGRCKDPENEYLNFMYKCNEEQRKVVAYFLEWCLSELFTVHETQIERALKNWKR